MAFRNRRFFLSVSVVVIVFATLPFALAYFSPGRGLVFSGALLNPLDGNTYFAKAYQGWRGEWRFKLPYTAEPGAGAYINLYYIVIGHAARWTGLTIDAVYHAARLGGLVLMLWALQRFLRRMLEDDFQQKAAFTLVALGLGLGWLAVPFNLVTSDLWVAEAFPLLAAMTNPHFPLGLALVLMLATPSAVDEKWAPVTAVGLALLLGVVSPFGVLIALLPWAGVVLVDLAKRFRSKSLNLGEMLRQPAYQVSAGILLGGGPVLLYDFLAIRSDPLLSAWDGQNLTGTPPWWDLIISFSPSLLLALWGFRRASTALRAWFFLGLLLIFIPLGLQRRFMMGLYIPIAILAAIGLDNLSASTGRRRLLTVVLTVLVLPGTLLLLATAVFGAFSDNPRVFMTLAEADALEWIEAETPEDALVLASPEMGLFIPARTGRRVIYGHPFETVDAVAMEAKVAAFFRNDGRNQPNLLETNGVDYVFFGPRESTLGPGWLDPALGLVEVFSSQTVKVYEVP